MLKYDIVMVGAGPANIFCAYELRNSGYTGSILIIEKGRCIEKRSCPKDITKKCVKCDPCQITCGFSGAGAFSDGKLSLSYEVGGDFPDLIGADRVQDLIDYTDAIYLKFGADPHVEGISDGNTISELRKKAISANLKLVDCPVRHLGTEKAHDLYASMQEWLQQHDVELQFNSTVTNLDTYDDDGNDSGKVTGVWVEDNTTKFVAFIRANKVIIGTGRRGAEWLFEQCKSHNIERTPGIVDIGVRVECRDEVMEQINKALYEGKLIGYPKPFGNKVRTFCQNPSGFVAQENYDENLNVVNGHSFKEKKSTNTNFAILCSHHFTTPFDDPIAYAKKVGQLTNMLGDHHILVQRFGDILEGKRTWEEELSRGNLKPSLPDAVAGDITAAIPYRTMTNIIEFIRMLDKVVPGIANDETLLYAPELKFYSNRITMDTHLNTSLRNLYCLGDSSGWTRGLMMASCMGVYCARELMDMED